MTQRGEIDPGPPRAAVAEEVFGQGYGVTGTSTTRTVSTASVERSVISTFAPAIAPDTLAVLPG